MKTLLTYLISKIDSGEPLSKEDLTLFLDVIDMTNEEQLENQLKLFI